ncbi:MAG: histidine phosphatase family protein [Alphaproteobacteria bacterium]|nr:histidine phosphatase family protein [Alphaproteobacteria bacterium]
MKRLLLMRHGKSDWGDASQDDFDRPLNARGHRASRAVGAWIAAQDLVPDTVLVSAAVRTSQTWKIIREEFPHAPEAEILPDLYLASPGTLLAYIERVNPATATTLVVGHNPGMETLTRLMAGPGSDAEANAELGLGFPTAGLAVIELNGEDWRTMSAEGGRLVDFLRPRSLDDC